MCKCVKSPKELLSKTISNLQVSITNYSPNDLCARLGSCTLFRIVRLFVARAFNMRFIMASYVHSIPRAGTVLDGRPLEFTHPAPLLHVHMCVVHVYAHMCVGYM